MRVCTLSEGTELRQTTRGDGREGEAQLSIGVPIALMQSRGFDEKRSED